MTDTVKCGVCGGTARLVREERDISVGARSAEVVVDFARCDACGEGIFLPGQMEKAQTAASKKIRMEEGLLQPSEVKKIRKKYGLNQDEFEELIGAGPKTVTRWENGTVFQNSTTDWLLKAIKKFPALAAWLGEQNGVEIDLPVTSVIRSGRLQGYKVETFDAFGARREPRKPDIVFGFEGSEQKGYVSIKARGGPVIPIAGLGGYLHSQARSSKKNWAAEA